MPPCEVTIFGFAFSRCACVFAECEKIGWVEFQLRVKVEGLDVMHLEFDCCAACLADRLRLQVREAGGWPQWASRAGWLEDLRYWFWCVHG